MSFLFLRATPRLPDQYLLLPFTFLVILIAKMAAVIAFFVAALSCCFIHNVGALSTSSSSSSEISRRHILRGSSYVSLTTPLLQQSLLSPPEHASAASSTGLANKLSQRDPSLLKNSVFNIPPSPQTYPEFLHGDWDVTMKFRGFLFPSTTIPKEKIVSNVAIPGFQKLSIATIGDVGREVTTYQMSIDKVTKLEDRKVSLSSSINGHLGYDAVRDVIYDPKDNPNRISIDFIRQRTRNANRIELFCNARESELVPAESSASDRTTFVCSEYIRQVTFGLSQEFGVARQVSGNYAHFWTWRGPPASSSTVTGNLLTAAYLDAQDPMFFEEPSRPVVVYSHDLLATRR
ncbi:hypothetical protein ACHAWC_008776 [Mediolabrus comicus]